MNFRSVFLASVIVLAFHSEPASAAPVTFTIDPARSTVSVSGSLTVPGVGTFSYKTQGAGSLTSSYGGSIAVELAPPNIIFPGGSQVIVNTNGSWQPAVGGQAGAAPADYAGEVTPPFTTSLFAGRDLQFDMSGSATLAADGSFTATNLVITYLTNSALPPSIDYMITSAIKSDNSSGNILLSGATSNLTTSATLSSGGGMLTLTLSVNVTNDVFIGYPTSTVLAGQIVATAPASAWPILIAISMQSGKLTLSWPSMPGQSYTVQSAQGLTKPWSAASGTMTATGGITTWTANSLPDSVQFYRVAGSF